MPKSSSPPPDIRASWQRIFSRQNWVAWLVLLSSLVVVLAFRQAARNSDLEHARQQFELSAREVGEAIDKRMQAHQQVLLGGVGLFDASEYVGREEWHRYLQRLELSVNYPGIQGVGYARVVAPGEQIALEREMRADVPDFSVWPQSSNSRQAVVIYIEPRTAINQAVLGFDMLSHFPRRVAVLQAAQSGGASISSKVTLVHRASSDAHTGLLMFMPVYRHGAALTTEAEREAALTGVVYSPFRADKLLAQVRGNREPDVDFALYDGRAVRADQLIFSSHPQDVHEPRFSMTYTKRVYGQPWTLRFDSTPAFEAGIHASQDALILLLGLITAVLVFLQVSFLTLRSLQAEALAQQMTEGMRRNEKALMHSEARFRLALEASGVGTWSWNVHEDQVVWDDYMHPLFGLAPGAFHGGYEAFLEMVAQEDRQRVKQAVTAALQQHVEFDSEYQVIWPDGSRHQVATRARVFHDDHGQPLMMTGTCWDVTERRRVDQMKSEFVSTVSHELRTPLTSISGSLGLVLGGVLGAVPETMLQMLRIAHDNSQRLSQLINDLLDMDKLVAGKMRFDMAVLPLMPMIEEAVASNQGYADQHHVRLQITEAAPGLAVRVDPLRLQQIMSNLLSNAIKFSAPGDAVEITVAATAGVVRVEIIDHGPGVPEAFKSQIFQKFTQADASDARRQGGTGLGLSICKEMVERMGGMIGFSSETGRGARFHFELPVQQSLLSRLPEQSPATVEGGQGERLLVVEDDPDIALLLSTLLRQQGYVVDVAYSAGQAFERLAETRYAAVTLDMMLPDQSGISVIRQLRDDVSTRDLPIVVVSAYVEDGQLAFHGQCVAVDWIQKPINENRLLAAVRLAVTGSHKPHVLHVEDDVDLQRVIAMSGQAVASFDHAASLTEARQRLLSQRYDLVLLDIILQDGSGWELLPQIQALQPPPPVIVLSGSSLSTAESRQVHAVLEKTQFSSETFVVTLSRALRRQTSDDQTPDRQES